MYRFCCCWIHLLRPVKAATKYIHYTHVNVRELSWRKYSAEVEFAVTAGRKPMVMVRDIRAGKIEDEIQELMNFLKYARKKMWQEREEGRESLDKLQDARRQKMIKDREIMRQEREGDRESLNGRLDDIGTN